MSRRTRAIERAPIGDLIVILIGFLFVAGVIVWAWLGSYL